MISGSAGSRRRADASGRRELAPGVGAGPPIVHARRCVPGPVHARPVIRQPLMAPTSSAARASPPMPPPRAGRGTRGPGTRQAGARFFPGIGAGHGGVEPGAGVPPGPVGGGQGDAQALGRLLQGQAAEEAQLDELGLERVVERELLQGLVQGQELLRGPAGAEGVEVRVFAPPAAAVLLAPLAAGVLDQDAAHRLGGGGEEVAAAVPAPGSPRRRRAGGTPRGPGRWPGASGPGLSRASRCAASRRSSS